jgi:hypothetical protein
MLVRAAGKLQEHQQTHKDTLLCSYGTLLRALLADHGQVPPRVEDHRRTAGCMACKAQMPRCSTQERLENGLRHLLAQGGAPCS